MASIHILENLSPANTYVFVIEDSPVDFEIIVRTFKRVEFFPDIHHCADGDEAMEFLHSIKNSNSIYPRPSLVLLDLNLPGTDGRQILTNMKADPELRKIPVIVLSTSNNENDIEFSLRQGADKYLKKPASLDDFAITATTIKNFWEMRILPHG
jgi:CheY-like chemotaxis protein